ncbi:hypothetical protein HN385_00570 [archaeon]|jgi:hypothetical protein|nr:hypothetical protein [archaeon]MBT3451583.1 hypothetical protein [archaeon]MBT6869603.1 hypothetical protein [archaeon]MBT7192372.1 hypothetical protein [archaeon]MBT7380173.1 hypothetical protein [archaeon]
MKFNHFGTFVGYLKHEIKLGEQYHMGVDLQPGYTAADRGIYDCVRTYTVTDSQSQIIASHKVKNIMYDDRKELEEDVSHYHAGSIFGELRPYFKEKDLELIVRGGMFRLEKVE